MTICVLDENLFGDLRFLNGPFFPNHPTCGVSLEESQEGSSSYAHKVKRE